MAGLTTASLAGHSHPWASRSGRGITQAACCWCWSSIDHLRFIAERFPIYAWAGLVPVQHDTSSLLAQCFGSTAPLSGCGSFGRAREAFRKGLQAIGAVYFSLAPIPSADLWQHW